MSWIYYKIFRWKAKSEVDKTLDEITGYNKRKKKNRGGPRFVGAIATVSDKIDSWKTNRKVKKKMKERQKNSASSYGSSTTRR